MKAVSVGATFCLAVLVLSLSPTCFGDKKPITDPLASTTPKPATCTNVPKAVDSSMKSMFLDITAKNLLLKDTLKFNDLKLQDPNKGPLVPNRDTAYILHVTSWSDPIASGGTPVMQESVWYVYRCGSGGNCKVTYTPPLNGNTPLLYNSRSASLISIEAFPFVKKGDDQPAPVTASLSYGFTVTHQTAANIASVTSALGAILGTKPKAAGALVPLVGKVGEDARAVCVAQYPIDSADVTHLPYDIKVTVTDKAAADKAATDKAAADKAATDRVAADKAVIAAMAAGDPDAVKKAAADQASKTAAAKAAAEQAAGNTASSLTQTFHALDREWWDLGIGMVTIPLRETVVSTANGKSTLSTVNRVNPYGFFDVFPFAAFAPKNDPRAPHFQVGVPLSGQPLHRPYAGIGEPLPWIEQYLGFAVDVFGGIDFMRSQYASTQNPHWVKKRVIGVELPVGQLLSKITGVKSK